MLSQFVAGGAISLINIALHAVMTTFLAARLRQLRGYKRRVTPRRLLTLIMTVAASLLMLAHCAQVGIWAFFYGLVGVTPADGDSLYFAFVNFTTLGYGEIVPVSHWRLIGPMTAMNGIILFGWSTAVLFAILRNAMLQLHIIDPEK